ncbi:MAG: RNA methyltransferase [Prevotella sp.]|nr:RNA methyltransferase [Prevotella sp.]
MEITSLHNPRIRHLLLLQQKSQQRRKDGLFVVEGRRELEHCLAAGYELDSLFVCQELCDAAIVDDARGQRYEVPRALYEHMAYRGSTEGVIAIVHERRQGLADLQLSPSPLVIVLERVEKPGNLGAVLRSADAAGADAVIVCDALTDLYNPNLIRASIGAVFTVPVVVCSSQECIAFLQQQGIQILTAQLQDSRLYYDTDMRRPTALVMGTESTGLTDQWREAATAHIRVPMLGRLDSLNVSVSAAILLYEAVRQRSC